MTDQVITITFFRFKEIKYKFWAFRMMGLGPGQLKQVKGQRFFKLMGSGRGNGFSWLPDWSTYSLLQVWDNESHAKEFFKTEFYQSYKKKSQHNLTFYLKMMQAVGSWDGKQPFEKSQSLTQGNNFIAVITRARIRNTKLWEFWRYAPKASRGVQKREEMIFAKGIGETPLLGMATFSIWEDLTALEKYAYSNKNHTKAIKLRSERNWYKEEMFCRFQPYSSFGNWEDFDCSMFSKNIKKAS